MCASERYRNIDSCLGRILGALDNRIKGMTSKWEVENSLFLALFELVRYDRPLAESVRKAYLHKTPEEAMAFVRALKHERIALEIKAIRESRPARV